MFACKSNEGDHGTEQLLRDAIEFICFSMQERARSGALARRRDIPFASAVSPALTGSKMNGLSLRNPSPLMSPPTIGVKHPPDVSRAIAMSSITGLMGQVMVPSRE